MEKSSVLRMAMGAIEERVDYEMTRVIDNILDVNTKAAAKRKITITLELTPDSKREKINLAATAKATLVATDPVSTALCITSNRKTGELVVAEMVPQIPGQVDMDGSEQDEPKLLRLVNHN